MAAADVMTARRGTITAVVAAGMVAAGIVVFDTVVTVVVMLSARRRSQAKAPCNQCHGEG
ncbi:hypothetical protein EDF57_108303 [Novosphingobium sp. PhB55]|nr:hypothetical protein EDF57_108303 [Novosphingobium sp. PhB55]